MLPWQKKASLGTLGLKIIMVAGNHLAMHLTVPLTPGRRRAGRTAFLMFCSPDFFTIIPSVVQVGTHPIFLDQCRSITSTHLHLRCHAPFSIILSGFNINVAMTHHPVIQNEVDELLAKSSVPLNHPLEVLPFLQMYLWFLSALAVYDPY